MLGKHRVRSIVLAAFAAFGASAALASSAGARGLPVTVVQVDADVIWVTESSADGTVLNTRPGRIVIDAADTDPAIVEEFPYDTNDEISVSMDGDPAYTEGNVIVSPGVTGAVTLIWQPGSDIAVVDGGTPGNAPTGPAGPSGVAPTTDYVQWLNLSPAYMLHAWVQCGYVQITVVPPGGDRPEAPVFEPCPAAQPVAATRFVALPTRGIYVSVEGNTDPFTGAAIKPGTLLDLEVGQPDTDPHYKGAQPAIFVEGIGVTGGPPPAGYVQKGLAGAAQHVSDGLYAYYVPGS